MKFYTILVCFLIAQIAQAQDQWLTHKTYSPHLLVQTKDQKNDALPLKENHVKVHISGVIASVEITQTYINKTDQTLEASYIFPASTRAAVHGMTMKIGKKTFMAKIQEKNAALQTYQTAKYNHQSAALLKQIRPNLFQMKVAGIEPNKTVEITLKYSELLVPQKGTYEFVYPAVIASKYAHKSGILENKEADVTRPSYEYNINLEIEAGMQIQNIKCVSHKIHINKQGDKTTIQLHEKEMNSGNRAFILRYKLADQSISTGVLLHEDPNGENYFMCMIQPPKSPSTTEIPPREYVFILDISGSMNGFPMRTAKKTLKTLIGRLRPTDRFNVLFFQGLNLMLNPESVPANKKNINMALDHIERHDGWGSSELLPVLQEALKFKETQNYARTFIVITDGFISLEKKTFDLIKNNLNRANLFAFGVGKSVNRYLIEGMSRAGQGIPFVVTKTEEVDTRVDELLDCIDKPALTNIRLSFHGINAYGVLPAKIPDVMVGRPVVIFGKYKGKARGNIMINGNTGKKNITMNIDFSQAKRTQNEAIKMFWARNKIMQLDDYELLTSNETDQNVEKQLIELGIKYNLLSSQTSFVAVDQSTYKPVDKITIPQNVSSIKKKGKTSPAKLVRLEPSRPTQAPTAPYREAGVTRSISPLSIQLPEETNTVLADCVWCAWKFKQKSDFEQFQVTISDMSDEILYETNTKDSLVKINLNRKELANYRSLIFKITALNHQKKPIFDTASKMIQRADKTEASEFAQLLKSQNKPQSNAAENTLARALFYEKNEYLIDAFREFHHLILISKEPKYQKAFEEFMKRNAL